MSDWGRPAEKVPPAGFFGLGGGWLLVFLDVFWGLGCFFWLWWASFASVGLALASDGWVQAGGLFRLPAAEFGLFTPPFLASSASKRLYFDFVPPNTCLWTSGRYKSRD